MSMTKLLRSALFHLACAIIGIVMFYPVMWMIMSSVKENSQIFTSAHTLIPEKFVFSNYNEGWKGFGGYTFATFFKNSFIITLVSTICTVFASSLVAYGFARVNFTGKRFCFICMMLTMMLPSQVLMIPQYLLFSKMNWINSFKPVIIPHSLGTAFFIFMIMQFIQGIPKELDEAAIIDGCSKYSIYFRVTIPLVKPALVTTAIFSFYWRWEDFITPLLYLNSPSRYPVSLALKLFADPQAVSNWGAMFAMGTVSLIPVFIVFFALQKYIVQGITMTGLKG